MRGVRTITAAVSIVTLLALTGPSATASTAGLTVITSPDPTTTSSVAYIYSPATLAAAPRVTVTGPRTNWSGTAMFQKDASPGQWWDAPLPHGAPGIYQVTVTAASGEATGTSSYQITGPATAGPRWTSTGPALPGGLMAVDPSNVNSIYVASAQAAELFATRDGGGSWQFLRTLPVAGGYPTALLAVPHDGRTELVLGINGGNGLYVDDPTYTGKVLASDDDGQHWRDLGMPDAFVRTVIATPDGQTLIAVTNSGIEVTRDDGAHWRQITVPWGASDYSAATLADGDLYVATLQGLYVVRNVASVSAGAPTAVFTPTGSSWVVNVAGDGADIYADAFRGGLYASSDGGRTWTHVYDPPTAVTMLDDVAGKLYMTGENSILVSGDGGKTWASWAEPVSGLDVESVWVTGRVVYVSTLDGGVFRTANQGASYQWLGGISDLDGDSVAVTGGELLTGTERGTFTALMAEAGTRTGWGNPFPLPVYNVTTPLLATTPDHTTVYKVVEGPRTGTFTVYRSTDAGTTWQPRGVTNYGVPGALLVDPATPADVYVAGASSLTGDALLISRNAGATWTSVRLPGAITALAGDPADPDRIWLGGPGGLWTSANGGKTLTELHTGAVSALDALGNGRLIVAGSRFYVSTDGGKTLTAASQPDLDLDVTALLTVGHVVYAGTGAFHESGLLKGGHGVLRSTDGGASWQLDSNGLTDRDVLSLAASPDGTRLYAGTQTGGVFTLRSPG